MTILIVSNSNDKDSHLVAAVLRQWDVPVQIWETDLFSLQQLGTFTIGAEGTGGGLLRTLGVELALRSVHSVWMRRPMVPTARPGLHPDDVPIAEAESKAFVSSLLGLVPASARWLNPRESIFNATNKLLQLLVAQREGLRVPETIATNDLDVLLAFAERHSGELLYKGFGTHQWNAGGDVRASYACKVDADALPSKDLIAACPGLYQRYVQKAFEVRCVVWADRCYAIKLHSAGRVDWRHGPVAALHPQPFDLPDAIETRCRRLLDSLGIAMGAFDFVVDECGEFFFLEVNEQGQFLFMEELCPELPVLDGFCRFLSRLGAEDAPHITLGELAEKVLS